MQALPWIAIFAAVPAAWWPAARWPALALLAVGYGAALLGGQLGLMAAIPVALLILVAWAVSPTRKPAVRYVGHIVFVALAVALSLHLLPGFHNLRVIGPERFTADAVPFTMYLNLDKPLIGFWLLLTLPWIRAPRDLRASLQAGLAAMLITSAACLAVAMLLGVVGWAPKRPASSALWLLNNLFLVTVTEEALFRGYLQGGLSRLLHARPYAEATALCVASLLFGLAHVAGGWPWIVLGGIAGIGYGLAYRFGGLRAAVLAHVGLNVTHFFLFTYPMLQRAAPQ